MVLKTNQIPDRTLGNDKCVGVVLKEAENTFASIKRMSDETMLRFRINMRLRAIGTIGAWSVAEADRRYEQAETARVRYVDAARALVCKMPGGRAYLAIRLTEYQAELEAALNDLLFESQFNRPSR